MVFSIPPKYSRLLGSSFSSLLYRAVCNLLGSHGRLRAPASGPGLWSSSTLAAVSWRSFSSAGSSVMPPAAHHPTNNDASYCTALPWARLSAAVFLKARYCQIPRLRRDSVHSCAWLSPGHLRSTDWHLPSPSSTPKSVTFPDSTLKTLKTPKTDAFPPSYFLDAWSTPLVNGRQTPAPAPSFALSTPVDRPSTSHSFKVRTPEDPDFHVNHFVPNNLPLPPVEPARRLSSSPGPLSAKQAGASQPIDQTFRPVGMDTSQMQTPPPTRHATSRAGLQQSGGRDFATPVTVVQRTPGQIPTADGLFNQTPFGYPSLQFSPEMLQFSNTGPMSAPPLPHSRLFWDQPNDGSQMDVDMPLASDPFGPTPHKIEGNVNWSTFHTPASNAQMNPRPFQTLHGMSSPGPMTSFASNAGGANLKPNSFVSPSGGVDPSMLFSFSSPRPAASFDHSAQPPKQAETRQPYETQLRDSLKEKEIVRQAKSQHSRTSTNSSVASFELSKPGLQRSNTDSGFRNSRPTSIDSRSPASTGGFNIPRRSSPLKRQSGGSLTAIPEMRRPKTRLIIDETGRARTETVPVEEDEMMGADARKDPHPQKDLRRQYPGLWADDESDTDEDEPATLSRNASFNIPQRRPPKHARADSGDLTRSNSFKIPRPSSGVFDKSTFETVRPVRRVADGVHRRFSMMDLPTSFNETEDSEDQTMPDSPGDALGALKKVVGDRQKRTDRVAQNALRAHNQRWAQASADLANVASYDPFTNSFIGSPNTADTGLTTPSTDRGSLSGDSTRCVCNGSDDGRSMVQCESCNKWLHMGCVGLTQNNLPPVYVCVFCTGQTPVARGGRVRGPMPAPFDSPLTHKSVFRRS